MKFYAILLIAGVMLLTGCAAQSVFSASFDDGTTVPPELTLTDAYAGIADDENALRLLVNNEVRGQTGQMLLTADAALQDYAITTRLRIHSGQLRVWVRADADGCQGYALTIDPTLDTYRLSRATNCVLETLRSSPLLDVRSDEWIDVRMEVRGSRIQVAINGAPFYDVEDSAYATGLPLIQLVNDSTIVAQSEFDHLTLSR
jgi:hypothetical protein